jgi:agmatinase
MHDMFDLPSSNENGLVQILPVSFDATTSYRPGAAKGPKAVLAASNQVDLCDADIGSLDEVGIHLNAFSKDIEKRNQEASEAVRQIREAKKNDKAPLQSDFAIVNTATKQNNIFVHDWTKLVLSQQRFPVILGGDHCVPFGAIKACAEHYADREFGVLHIDAHCDLRDAYEGFEDSHASIMFNVQSKIPQVKKIVQVGIRDFSEEELNVITNSNRRILTFFDKQLRQYRTQGRFLDACKRIVQALPNYVYLSFDIDGMDPTLCPGTGTPVPGGLNFDELIVLLECLIAHQKIIIGLDLCEVSPPTHLSQEEWGDTWDANVGARVLYKMIGFSLLSQGLKSIKPPQLPAW